MGQLGGWSLVGLGALITIAGFGGSSNNSVGALFFGVIIAFIGIFITSRKNESAEVKKDDLLREANVTGVTSQSNDDESVYIGLDNGGRETYIQTDDRSVVIGPPGTGKTTFQINQIYKWIETGNSFVCLDIKPEIAKITKKRLKDNGYRILIFNPTNPIDRYNFLVDLETPEAIGEFASAMIPSSKGENVVFDETARDFLDAVILHVKTVKDTDKATLAGVYDLITGYSNIKALLNDLAHSRNEQCRRIVQTLRIVADNERLLGSIFATFVSNLRFLRYDNIRESLGRDGFSLSVLRDPKTALFLQFEEATTKTTGHLFSVMVGHLLNYLITNTNRKAVLCLFDEIGNAGKINDLTGKLNTIRSRKMPTWLYFQSKEQMQKYGEKTDEGANIIMGACDFQMCFRLNDNATAEWFSKKIGTQEIVKTSVNSGERITYSDSIDRENVIHPHELQQLKNNEVVVSYRGVNWIGTAEPYYVVEEREELKRNREEMEFKRLREIEERKKRHNEALLRVGKQGLKGAKKTGQITKTIVRKSIDVIKK